MTAKIHKKCKGQSNTWKDKAKTRGAELRAKNKRIKELIKSRDLHKLKWQKERQLREADKKALQNFQKKSQNLKYHSYNLESVAICMAVKHSGNMSLRCCRSMLLTMCFLFNINFKVPCINTLRNWEHKNGYYRLKKRGDSTVDYVVIVDESFSIGHQSLLLVLGINMSVYNFGSSLQMSDVEVLAMEVKKSWKSADISKVITGIRNRGYSLLYCCSDGANNLVRAMKDSDLCRIYDCTHALSLLIKKEYEKKEVFKNFLKEYALLNRKNYMGQDSMICPPKLRGKARFLNIYPIAEWAERTLKYSTILSNKTRTKEEERIYQKLIWLDKYSILINELIEVSKLLKSVFKILKKEGLVKASIKATEELVSFSKAPLFIRVGIRSYLKEQQIHLKKYGRMICCSDIIESYFGKFKYNQTKNPNKGITIGCLDIVNYGEEIEIHELKKAMEGTRIVDLKKWRKENKLKAFNNQKKELFKKWG